LSLGPPIFAKAYHSTAVNRHQGRETSGQAFGVIRSSDGKDFSADVANPLTPSLKSEIMTSVHSRRVIRLSRRREARLRVGALTAESVLTRKATRADAAYRVA